MDRSLAAFIFKDIFQSKAMITILSEVIIDPINQLIVISIAVLI